jgi:hypothetical protein
MRTICYDDGIADHEKCGFTSKPAIWTSWLLPWHTEVLYLRLSPASDAHGTLLNGQRSTLLMSQINGVILSQLWFRRIGRLS